MSLPAFASVESSLSGLALAALRNLRLTSGGVAFDAVYDRSVEFLGEYGPSSERRARITVLRSAAAGFTNGGTLNADSATYTAGEIAAMEGAGVYKLDRLADDDGHLVSWWLK